MSTFLLDTIVAKNELLDQTYHISSSRPELWDMHVLIQTVIQLQNVQPHDKWQQQAKLSLG